MATPSRSSVQEQIKEQGEIVRQLKKDKAPQEKVGGWFNSVPRPYLRPGLSGYFCTRGTNGVDVT